MSEKPSDLRVRVQEDDECYWCRTHIPPGQERSRTWYFGALMLWCSDECKLAWHRSED